MSDIRTILWDPDRAQFRVDPDWQGTIPYWLTPERQVLYTVPANSPLTIPVVLRHEGTFRGEYMFCRWPDRDYTVSPFFGLRLNGAGGYRFNNNDIPVLSWLVASPFGGRPAVLPEAVMVEYGRQLTLTLNDMSGGDQDISFALGGLLYIPVRFGTATMANRLKRERERYNWLRPHWSAPDGDGHGKIVPAGGQLDLEFTIDQTGFFEVSKMAVWVGTGVGSGYEDLSIRMWDPGERSLMTFQLPLDYFGGFSEYPYIIPVKWGLYPDAKVRVTLYNAGVGDLTVWMALIGRRLLGNVERH